MTPQTDLRDVDDALARAARRAHAASLDQLSPRVQAQLAQRRRAAMQPRRAAARGAWPLIAAASSAALALAIGVFALRDADMPAAQVADAPVAAPSAQTDPAGANPGRPVTMPDAASALPDTLIAAEFDAADAIDAASYGAFEETPDFYAWLGSEDTLADVTESL